jgi:hypothetical protein
MKLQPVESSLIEAVGDRETRSTLEVVFNSDKTYGYFEVPQTVYLQLMASDSKASYIAILAGVVNFLPHPNPPRTRSLGSKKFTNDARIAICYLTLLTAFPRSEETAQISTALISAWNTSHFQDE